MLKTNKMGNVFVWAWWCDITQKEKLEENIVSRPRSPQPCRQRALAAIRENSSDDDDTDDEDCIEL